MSVSLVGYTQAEYVEDGGQAVAWPSGTAVGDTGVVDTCTGPGRKPETLLPGGWTLLRADSSGMAMYGKLSLTAGDIAGDLDLNAVVAGLSVHSGVVGFGATTAQAGATVPTVGDAFHTFGSIIAYSPDALTPPDGRINATDAIIEHWTKVRISARKTKWKLRRLNAWTTTPAAAGYSQLVTNADRAMSVVLLGTLPATETSANDITLVSPVDGDVIDYGTSYLFRWTSSKYTPTYGGLAK